MGLSLDVYGIVFCNLSEHTDLHSYKQNALCQ